MKAKTISGVAVMALRWFAGETGAFGDPLDRAPERAIIMELLDAGLIVGGGWGAAYEPTAKGDALLAGSRVEIASESFVQEHARATVKTVMVLGLRPRSWSETTIRVRSKKLGHTITFNYTDERSQHPHATESETRERMAFCIRSAEMKTYAA